jgi:hypothetical protein
VYFEPQPALYGELKPLAHSDPAMRRVLPELVADAQLAVHAWTVLLHNSRLGALHPQYTAHNVFGDGYVYSLCPMHDAVFAYAVNLCRDIAAQGVHSLVLETPGWLPYAHGYHHEFAQVRSNVWLDTMLGLCFCDACMAAGRQHGAGHGQPARFDSKQRRPVSASARGCHARTGASMAAGRPAGYACAGRLAKAAPASRDGVAGRYPCRHPAAG